LFRVKKPVRNKETTICEEKSRLLNEYTAATQAFSQAVTELNNRAGTSSREQYRQLQRVVEDARTKSDFARHALDKHMAEDGC
jgi:hypothetical protein